MPSSDREGGPEPVPFDIFDHTIVLLSAPLLTIRVLVQMVHTSYGPRNSVRQYVLIVWFGQHMVAVLCSRVMSTARTNSHVEPHDLMPEPHAWGYGVGDAYII